MNLCVCFQLEILMDCHTYRYIYSLDLLVTISCTPQCAFGITAVTAANLATSGTLSLLLSSNSLSPAV